MVKRAISLAVLVVATLAQAQQSDAVQVEALARRFGEAWLKADVKTLDSLLAREYTHTDVTGKVLHRADWLADAGNAQRWLRGDARGASPAIEFYDVRVQVMGNTAVITGGNTIRPGDAKRPPMTLRFTQVWVKEDRQWKRRFFQATPVPGPNP